MGIVVTYVRPSVCLSVCLCLSVCQNGIHFVSASIFRLTGPRKVRMFFTRRPKGQMGIVIAYVCLSFCLYVHMTYLINSWYFSYFFKLGWIILHSPEMVDRLTPIISEVLGRISLVYWSFITHFIKGGAVTSVCVEGRGTLMESGHSLGWITSASNHWN